MRKGKGVRKRRGDREEGVREEEGKGGRGERGERS